MRHLARHAGGYTLVELMVTLVVLGILAAIAVPVYSGYMASARRTDAKTALGDAAVRLEKYFTDYLEYPADPGDAGIADTSDEGWYRVEVHAHGAGYRVVATADPAGRQRGDSKCRRFVIESDGERLAWDAGGNETTGECW